MDLFRKKVIQPERVTNLKKELKLKDLIMLGCRSKRSVPWDETFGCFCWLTIINWHAIDFEYGSRSNLLC